MNSEPIPRKTAVHNATRAEREPYPACLDYNLVRQNNQEKENFYERRARL